MSGHIMVRLAAVFLIVIALGVERSPAHSHNALGIELKINLKKQSYEIGESIDTACEIRNVSKSSIWLPPLQMVDTHFILYDNNDHVLPLEITSLPLYGSEELQVIELLPGQSHAFNRVLDRDGYRIPVVAGQYRLCVLYENNKHSMRNINFWVGEIESCVLPKIR